MPEMTLKIELSEDAKKLLQRLSSLRAESNDAGEVWHLRQWKGLQPFLMPERPCAGRNVTPVGKGKDFPGNGKAPKEEDRLIDCVDCQVFAREFNRRNPSIDEGYLLGWFATAIENGKSAGRREAAAKESKSSDHAAYTAGYHASAPTNSDGKTSSPPGVKSAAGPSLNIKIGLFPGDFVLHLPTGSAMEITASTSDERSTALVDGVLFNDWTTNFKKIPRETHRILVAKQRAAQELREALGLLTTLAPKMVIDPDHPMKMAQEIEKHVREVFEKCDESARTVNTMRADHDAALDEIVSEVPTSFRRSSVKESVKLLAAAFMGLREIFGSKT